MCGKCYSLWKRRNPGVTIPRSFLKLRVRDGAKEYRCTGCSKRGRDPWHREESFYTERYAATRLGVTCRCKTCHREDKRAWHHKHKERVNAERLIHAREMQRRKKHADRAFGLWKQKTAGFSVPKELVHPWLDKILADHKDNHEAAASAAGISVRRIHDIYNPKPGGMGVAIETAERLAMEADTLDELEKLLPPVGRDGWSPHGERWCRRCGSWFHEHHARGYCRDCYGRVNYYENVGRPTPIPMDERWDARKGNYLACRWCDSATRPHRAHGLCIECYHVAEFAVSKGMGPMSVVAWVQRKETLQLLLGMARSKVVAKPAGGPGDGVAVSLQPECASKSDRIAA